MLLVFNVLIVLGMLGAVCWQSIVNENTHKKIRNLNGEIEGLREQLKLCWQEITRNSFPEEPVDKK